MLEFILVYPLSSFLMYFGKNVSTLKAVGEWSPQLARPGLVTHKDDTNITRENSSLRNPFSIKPFSSNLSAYNLMLLDQLVLALQSI